MIGSETVFGPAVDEDSGDNYKNLMNLVARQQIVLFFASVALLVGCSDSPQVKVTKPFDSVKILADKGDQEAQFNLGMYYYFGEGVDKDLVHAVSWWRKAADQGHAKAQYRVGYSYQMGDGDLAKNPEKAMSWCLKSADQGFADAQCTLAICYLKGEGVASDSVKAAYWFRKAADQGHADAEFGIGNCYSAGQGVTKDLIQAISWWRKAAGQGFKEAENCLGVCYASGNGVPKDEVEAYAYYNLAGIMGYEVARANLVSLETRLSRQEIAAGQKRTKELQEEIEAKIAAKKAGK